MVGEMVGEVSGWVGALTHIGFLLMFALDGPSCASRPLFPDPNYSSIPESLPQSIPIQG